MQSDLSRGAAYLPLVSEIPLVEMKACTHFEARAWRGCDTIHKRSSDEGMQRALLERLTDPYFHLRPYRDEPSASRPIRADKHRRGQRVLTWVTSREHCAAAGFFFASLD